MEEERLAAWAAEYGIFLVPQQLKTLAVYEKTLLEWNEKINLTAITDPREVEIKHFLDSFLLAKQPEVQGKLVDVGSGAGFPGMVAKIYKPQLGVTLLEPTGKRVRFLQALAEELQLPVEVVKERAEEAARKSWREQFDFATARAVAALPMLCEYCLPLVRVGGVFIAMKAAEAAAEVQLAQKAIVKLGGTYRETRTFTLPDGAVRSMVVIEKTAKMPPAYPRNGGVIAKRPL